MQRLSTAGTVCLVVCGAAWVPGTQAWGQIRVQDDFEGYADTAAMKAVWPTTASSVLDTSLGHPGQSMYHPSGVTAKQVFVATVPTDLNPILWQFDFYDDGSVLTPPLTAGANKRATGGLRNDGHGGSLTAILEMGRYNDAAEDPKFGYAYRTVFLPGSTNWHLFPGVSVQQGWHRFSAVIGASDITFRLDLGADGTIDSSAVVAANSSVVGYDVARFGGPSDLTTFDGFGANYDNVLIAVIPEPAGLGVLGGLVSVSAIRRPRRGQGSGPTRSTAGSN